MNKIIIDDNTTDAEYDITQSSYGISIRGEIKGADPIRRVGTQTYRLVVRPDGSHTLECSQKGKNFCLRLKDKDIIGLKKVIDLYLK